MSIVVAGLAAGAARIAAECSEHWSAVQFVVVVQSVVFVVVPGPGARGFVQSVPVPGCCFPTFDSFGSSFVVVVFASSSG